jgi:hypothetical protein
MDDHCIRSIRVDVSVKLGEAGGGGCRSDVGGEVLGREPERNKMSKGTISLPLEGRFTRKKLFGELVARRANRISGEIGEGKNRTLKNPFQEQSGLKLRQ